MIRKGRLVKNTAIALAIISVFGSTLSTVSADEIGKNREIEVVQYDAVTAATVGGPTDSESSTEDNLNIALKHLTEDKDSSGNRYLKSSVLKKVGTKQYIVMTFNSGNMFTAMQASIKGKDVETKFEKDEANDTVTVEFEVSSLSDYMELSFTYNTPIGAMTHSARIQTEENKNSVKPEIDMTEENLDIALRHLTEDRDSSGNKYLKSSVLKNVNGKQYIVMTFDSGSMFTAMQASIKGKDVETKFEKDEANDTVTVEFEVSSLSDYMELSFTYNTPIGAMTHSARIQTEENKDSVKPEEDDSIATPNPDTGNDSNAGDSTTTPDKEDEYGDGYYQVNNIIDHESETGKEMARNLIQEVTNMEVKDGKVYLTFTMNKELAPLAQDKVAKVNGTEVEIKEDGNYFTIEVPNLDAEIELSMFIVAMGRTQTFTITFDKSTVVEKMDGNNAESEGQKPESGVENDTTDEDNEELEDEKSEVTTDDNEVSEEDVENETLPQTGSAFGSEILLGLGGLLTASGVLLRRKRK